MKNMYRIICLVLSMVMLLSVTSVFAENKIFSDVKETGKYSEAIYTLTDLGILKGDAGSDTFRPSANISREEFSVIMTRFLAAENLPVNITTYPFTDVTPETCADWSIKATKIAYDMGIVQGYDEGIFGPKDPVTYEQAVKMIVCALGLKNAALKAGGWPQGYIAVAINNKITTGAEYANNQPAPREIIAQLIFNSLEVNMSIGAEGNYTILTDKLGLFKGEGIITANGTTSLDATGAAIKEDQIEIEDSKGKRTLYDAGTSGAAAYLGQRVNFYYKDVNGINTLVSARPERAAKVLTFESDEIESISKSEIKIYDEPDGNTSLITSYEFDDPYVIYNGKYASQSDIAIPEIGSVTIKNIDNDSKFDIIEIINTEVFVVRAIDTAQNKIYDRYKQDNFISTAPSSQRTVTVTRGSASSSLDAIQKDDVLLVSESKNPSGKSTLNIKIITKKITGDVTATSSDEFVVNGKTYEASKKYLDWATSEKGDGLIAIGDEVICYLDENDIILYAVINESTATANYSYGYILGAEHKTGGASAGSARISLLNSVGNEKTYTLSSKVRINGDQKTEPTEALAALDAANADTNKDAGAKDTDYAQLVKYVVNVQGEVSAILTMEDGTKYNPNKLTLSKKYDSEGVKYSPSSKMLGTVMVNSSTIVFTIPTDRAETEDYSVGKIDSLNNSEEYKFEAYDSDQGIAKVVLLYGVSGATVDSTSAPVVIAQEIRNISVDGEVTDELTCYVDGSREKFTALDTSVLAGVKTGDVIKLAFDAEGKIKEIKKLFIASTQTAKDYSTEDKKEDYSFYQGGNNAGTQDAEIMTVFGTVYQAFDSNMFIAVGKKVDDNGELDTKDKIQPINYDAEKGAVYYIYDIEKGKLSIGSYADIIDHETAMSGAAQVFTYSSYGTTKFVVVCK